MTNVTSSIKRTRHACLAALLSLLMPGVGHAYCGQLTRGLAFGLLYGVAIPAVLGLLAYFGPASAVQFGFLMIFASLGVVVAAAADASGWPREPGAITNPETALNCAPLVVQEYHCFVLGDNRNYSLDSRHFGPIPYATIEGRADYIYWPADTWTRFGALR